MDIFKIHSAEAFITYSLATGSFCGASFSRPTVTCAGGSPNQSVVVFLESSSRTIGKHEDLLLCISAVPSNSQRSRCRTEMESASERTISENFWLHLIFPTWCKVISIFLRLSSNVNRVWRGGVYCRFPVSLLITVTPTFEATKTTTLEVIPIFSLGFSPPSKTVAVHHGGWICSVTRTKMMHPILIFHDANDFIKWLL